MKLLIATPAYGGLLTTDYAGSLLNSLRYCQEQKIEASVYFVKNESLISRARNNCASYFLRGDYDKLLFIDSDQGWTTRDLGRLLSSKRTLVGGTYPKKTFPCDLNFTPLSEHDSAHFPGKIRSADGFLKYVAAVADESGEAEVMHLATGFLLIDRSVFLALQNGCPSYLARDNQHAEETRQWDFFPAGVINGSYESEDFFFCSQAATAGHPPYLNTQVIVDHIGSFNFKLPGELRPPVIPL
jgi:hypothetical protein